MYTGKKERNKLFVLFMTLFFIFSSPLSFFPLPTEICALVETQIPLESSSAETKQERVLPITLEDLELDSTHVLIRELSIPSESGEPSYIDLAAVGSQERIYPASMTKLMTVLLALDALESGLIRLDQETEAGPEDLEGLEEANASVLGLESGEKISVRDLLYACLLESGNDAANVLMHVLSDHPVYFSQLMNIKAEELGLKDSHFSNPTGLHAEDNYSTLSDMALILQACLAKPLFREISSTLHYQSAASAEHPDGFDMEHTLLPYAEATDTELKYIQGGKTGRIVESGYSLASYCHFANKDYIVVSSNAYDYGANVSDHEKIYTYLFEEAKLVTLLTQGDHIALLPISGAASDESLLITVPETVQLPFTPIDTLSRYNYELSLPSSLKAPLAANDVIGEMRITDQRSGELVYAYAFTPGREIKQSRWSYFLEVTKPYAVYVLAFLFLLLILYLIHRHNKRKRARAYRKNRR